MEGFWFEGNLSVRVKYKACAEVLWVFASGLGFLSYGLRFRV